MSDELRDEGRVRRRHVIHVAGYDPADPAEHYRRFARQLPIFASTWNVDASASGIERRDGFPAWTVQARGPNWRTEAVYELWPWDDIVHADAARSSGGRLLRAFDTYLEYIVTGTILRYVRANTRYFLFAIVPPLQILLLAAVAWGLAAWLAGLAGLQGWPRLAVAAVLGVGGFAALLRWPGRPWRVEQALDDWILSRDYIHGRHAAIEERLDRFAEALVRRVAENGKSEVVLVGHSLGATFVLDIAARALALDPELGRRGASLSVLTVGATIPKCTLHPDAHRIRARIGAVLNEPSIFWAEFQARGDAISFYRFHPARLERIEGETERIEGKPVVRRVHIHNMLWRDTFRRYRYRALRLHYQSVMANERRATYDYFMMICGPVPLPVWSVTPLALLDHYNFYFDASVREASLREPVP